jgi:hypothetical protein
MGQAWSPTEKDAVPPLTTETETSDEKRATHLLENEAARVQAQVLKAEDCGLKSCIDHTFHQFRVYISKNNLTYDLQDLYKRYDEAGINDGNPSVEQILRKNTFVTFLTRTYNEMVKAAENEAAEAVEAAEAARLGTTPHNLAWWKSRNMKIK